jgi:hypothetical protein
MDFAARRADSRRRNPPYAEHGGIRFRCSALQASFDLFSFPGRLVSVHPESEKAHEISDSIVHSAVFGGRTGSNPRPCSGAGRAKGREAKGHGGKAKGRTGKTAIDCREIAGLPRNRRCNQRAVELLRRDLSADAKTQGAGREGRERLPFHQGRRRTADLLQRLCGEDSQAAVVTGKRVEVATATYAELPLHVVDRGGAQSSEWLVARTAKDLVVSADICFSERSNRDLKGAAELSICLLRQPERGHRLLRSDRLLAAVDD